jgi:hypothetical protein
VSRSRSSRLRPLATAIAIICVLGLVAAACGSAPTAAPSTWRSVVQLGDSVASGEGTLYGYTYDQTTRRWMGGNVDAVWPGPYPLCHVSPDAYGHVLAAQLHARFAQFACTGRNPWGYGLFIINPLDPSSLLSQAPFHPTPRGQRQIASLVEPAVNRLFARS